MENKKHKWYNEIIAWANGEIIQVRYNACQQWKDITWVPSWDNNAQYRIKPKPKLVPFTFEDRDLFRGKWIKRKTDGCEFLIIQIYLKSIYHQAHNCIGYDELLEKFEFLDGSPCGKIINE